MHSIQMSEDIVELLCGPGSPIILVFDPGPDTQFQCEPQQGLKIQRGWENFAIFDGYRHLSRKRYEIGP